MDRDYYRGYLLIRLASIGTEWEISDKLMELSDESGHWHITNVSIIYGSWDLVVEILFDSLESFDKLVVLLRSDENLRHNFEELTTLVSNKANYLALREKFKKG